jgi:hypothetical protein
LHQPIGILEFEGRLSKKKIFYFAINKQDKNYKKYLAFASGIKIEPLVEHKLELVCFLKSALSKFI